MAKAGNRFELELPEEWEDQTMYIYKGPEINGFQHDLMLVIDDVLESDNLKDFARERIDVLMNSMQNMEILKEEEKTLENGYKAYEAVIKWIPVDDKIIFQKRVYMIIEGIGYTFSANLTKMTMKTIGLQINKIIESFNPLKSDSE